MKFTKKLINSLPIKTKSTLVICLVKQDLRWGKSPFERRESAEILIREALRNGKKSFGELLTLTNLSRTALANNLKRMYRRREVTKEVSPKDFRVTYYLLTKKGEALLYKQQEIATLNSKTFKARREDFTVLSPEDVSKIVGATVNAFLALQGKVLCEIYPLGRSRELLKQCVSFSIFSDEAGSDGSLETVTKVAESAKSAMLGAMEVLNESDLRRISKYAVVFRFDKDKVDEYLRTYEAVCKKRALS